MVMCQGQLKLYNSNAIPAGAKRGRKHPQGITKVSIYLYIKKIPKNKNPVMQLDDKNPS